MRTFSIQTLGCRVNHYESEQIATLLRGHGFLQVEQGGDVRVVNTCSVTVEAAAKSRQLSRRAGRVSLPVLSSTATPPTVPDLDRSRVIVTGCWATSDREAARQLPGVGLVVGHGDDVAAEITKFLAREPAAGGAAEGPLGEGRPNRPVAAEPQGGSTLANKPRASEAVNEDSLQAGDPDRVKFGTMSLPLLGARQARHQRAFLKVQDGCDAHCTYCIIPRLRPALYSKPVDEAVSEARALVGAGHGEIVLTGIFLGAFGQATALRRHQAQGRQPIAQLVEALCTRVAGLKRLRLSSIEPGDLTADLIAVLRAHAQVTPHFHLPLQSGSDRLLRRMNRQYTRDDFLRMVDQVRGAFDRPALTTDVIAGFPGEADADFADTLKVVDEAGFIHVHAFPFSPRPGTAAARWEDDFVPANVARERVAGLARRAAEHDLRFRRQFMGREVEVLVERSLVARGQHHGRCERYFDVTFNDDDARAGDAVRLRVTAVTEDVTLGERVN